MGTLLGVYFVVVTHIHLSWSYQGPSQRRATICGLQPQTVGGRRRWLIAMWRDLYSLGVFTFIVVLHVPIFTHRFANRNQFLGPYSSLGFWAEISQGRDEMLMRNEIRVKWLGGEQTVILAFWAGAPNTHVKTKQREHLTILYPRMTSDFTSASIFQHLLH